MKSLQDIKDAVKAGKTVHWSNTGYVVFCDSIGQWLIKFLPNNHCFGLTDAYDPQDFFTA